MNFTKKYFETGNFTMAYSLIIDDNIRLFDSEYGHIGYFDTENRRLFVGDPLCSNDDLEILVDEFILKSKGKKIVGLQCGEKTGKIFQKKGYDITKMGVETILNINSFNIKGKKKAKVRRWVNTAKNAGIEVCEGTIKDTYDTMKPISDEWLIKKGPDELNILTRSFSKNETEYNRVFFSKRKLDQKILGFVIFDPMFEAFNIVGYYANICRFSNDAPNGCFDIIIQQALEKFKSENIQWLSLGLSPLADTVPIKTDNYFVRKVAEINYKYGESMYSFKGIDFHKKAYHDEISSRRRPVYIVTKGFVPILDVAYTFSAVGIIPDTNLFYPVYNLAKGYIESALRNFFSAGIAIKNE